MLVLTRHIGENIVIAGDIRVTVLAIKGQRVRLGIAAPTAVSIARQEILAEEPPRAGQQGAAQPSLAANGRVARAPVNGDGQAAPGTPRLRRNHER